MHGGSTPTHRAAGERRVAEQQAARLAARFVTRKDIHPADALLVLVQWTAGEVDYWRAQVNALADEHLAGNLTTKTETGTDKGQATDLRTTEAATHIAVRLLAEASDRLARYAAAALKAGVDERRVRITESQGQLWVSQSGGSSMPSTCHPPSRLRIRLEDEIASCVECHTV
ncbi:hypothetical protein [Allobranchiibius huperziae]|uniref:Uncharacterized protein n=1 Tax=Allobranchiibius huperziae TaxID=1874116 RepID=A0A853DN94_9MICO|nr:hypothetical protein [Allobranchiibius huperziae]NYJ76080.1 hypothetical protein [Allobranchiibius huperziae]